MSAPRYLANGNKTPEYMAYCAMLQRCGIYAGATPEVLACYADRGITVGPEFLPPNGYDNWYNHIGPKPSPELEQDRMDNNGNYVYGNIRWATGSENASNRRWSGQQRFHTYNDKTQTIEQWALELELNYRVLAKKLGQGLTIEEIIKSHRKQIQYTYNGESLTEYGWHCKTGISRQAIRDGFLRGKTIEQILRFYEII